MEIFNNIQQFFIALVTTITTAVMVILPINKPQMQPVPTSTPVQEVQEATPTATPATEVKGISTKGNNVTPASKPKIPKPTTISTSASIPQPLPILPQQVTQAPQMNIEAICRGYADELRATGRELIGISIYDSNPYYERSTASFYNYCLSHNGDTSGFKPVPPLQQAPSPAPAIVPDNSWQQKTCTDGIREVIANLEGRKQEAINTATVNAQNECVRRGYPPPDYGSCKALIDQRVADVLASSSYDFMIKDVKLEYGCP